MMKPKNGESKEDFMKRFMTDPDMIKEYPDESKRMAACEEMCKDYADLKSIQGVEIFATGKWNGDEYTQGDLQEIVNSFNQLKQTLQPYVKLGHNEKQPLLAKDGLPAAGWIENVYIQGNKLLADIKDIPATIYELIKNKGYKRISSEIYWNLKDASGQVYKRALKAIALLGGDTPAVGSLADVQALYTKRSISDLEGDLRIAEHYTKEDIMDVETLKAAHKSQMDELTAKLTAKEKAYSELEAAKVAVEKENKDLVSKVEQFELSEVKGVVEKRVDGLIEKKKLLPANKQYAIDTLMKEVSVKTYSEKKDKVFEDSAFIKLMESNADVVDTKEKTDSVAIADAKAKELAKAEAVKAAGTYKEAVSAYVKEE